MSAQRQTTTEQYRYLKKWRLDRQRGLPRYVDPAPARDHITTLLVAGASRRAVAAAAGISPSVISRILADQAHLRRVTADAILKVTVEQLRARTGGRDFVPDLGARRRIQALMAIGHSAAAIATATGDPDVSIRIVYNVLNKPGRWISQANHDRFDAAFRALAMTPGASTRSRTTAQAKGWAPPLAWEDLDDPAATPNLGDTTDDRGYRRLHLDDLEHLLDNDGPWTWEGITARLGVSRSAIENACARHDRRDLLARITTTRGNAA